MARKSSQTKEPASAARRRAKPKPGHASERRRVHVAVHRFVGRLGIEVEDAIDAARARQLAPIRGILQNWRYLWRRYLAPEAVSRQQQTYPRPPIGWVDIEPDLATGLALLDTREWNACYESLANAVRELEQYEGQPFKRKLPRIITGEDADVVPTQIQDDSEDSLLNKVEQDARTIVALFNKLEDSLAADAEAEPAAKPRNRGGGRRPDPAIEKRNRDVAKDYNKGVTHDALAQKYRISATLVRTILSKARKQGLLPATKKRES